MDTFTQQYAKSSISRPPEVYTSIANEVLDQALKRGVAKEAKDLTVLDVGSGRGLYSFALAPHVARVVGVEPFIDHYELSRENNKFDNVSFFNTPVEEFETPERFDVAISLTTIEHMPEARRSFEKIVSLLKPGGMIYVTAPNKLWPYDNHYNLPLITWLPSWLADPYVRLTGRASSFKDSSYAKTYFGMKRLFSNLGCTVEFVVPDTDLTYLGCGNKSSLRDLGISTIKRFKFMWIFSKGFIVIVRKK